MYILFELDPSHPPFLYLIGFFNEDALIRKLQLGNSDLKEFLTCVFELCGVAVVKIGDIRQENRRPRYGCNMGLGSFCRCSMKICSVV